LDNDDVQFLGETFAHLDRCNDGSSKKEETDLVMSAVPNLSKESKQEGNYHDVSSRITCCWDTKGESSKNPGNDE